MIKARQSFILSPILRFWELDIMTSFEDKNAMNLWMESSSDLGHNLDTQIAIAEFVVAYDKWCGGPLSPTRKGVLLLFSS
jgi:hypothetical protein